MWDIARSGVFVGYGLLTLALGLALSMQWQAPRWPRLINSELLIFVTLLSWPARRRTPRRAWTRLRQTAPPGPRSSQERG